MAACTSLITCTQQHAAHRPQRPRYKRQHSHLRCCVMGSVLVPGSLKLDEARGALPSFSSFRNMWAPDATTAGGGIQQLTGGRLPAATYKREAPPAR